MSDRRAAAIALLALISASVAATLVVLSDHDTSKAATIALAAPLGLSFIGAGIVAARRRPENRTGLLLIATGFAWFLGALPESNRPLVFSIGYACGALTLGFLIHLMLAFPSGRLGSRGVRALAVGGYVLVATANLALMLVDDLADHCGGGCPTNVFLVSRQPAVADAIQAVTAVAAAVLAVCIVAVLARRWRAATPLLRRALTPVFAAGGVTLVLAAANVVVGTISQDAQRPFYWLLLASLLAVPLAFVWGLLRGRLATAAVGRLLAETPEAPTQEEAQDSLRRALRDPTLELAFWLPERRGFVDPGGRAFSVREDDLRVSTPIDLEGEPLAVVVHDPALVEEPEVLAGVLAAATLALQKDRLQAQLRARLDELQRERDFVATVVNTAEAFFCVLDTDGGIVRFNTTLEEMSGRADEDAVRGLPFWEVFPIEAAAAEVRAAIAARAEGELEHEWQSADGDSRIVGWHLTPLPDDKLLVSGVDVTARRRAERDLRLHVQLLSDLADASAALLVIVREDGRHTDDSINRAAKDAFGFEPGELFRRTFWDVFIPAEDRAMAEAAIRAAVAGEPPQERESHWLTKGGDRRLVAWSCALMPPIGDGKRIVSVNGIDVTERRRMLDEQAALRRVATLVAEDPDPKALLQAVTREVGLLFGGDTATIFRYLDQTHVTVMGGWSDSGERSLELGTERLLDGETAAVLVHRTQAPARIDDYREVEGEFARFLLDSGLRCSIAAPVIVGGAVWGAISASSTHEQQFPPGAENRLGSFASLVAQAIANADARHELRQAAARIVEAGDSERRRLERNLHDGAQQRLVTLSLALRLAQNRLADDPQGARTILEGASTELTQALQELRELARGLHPAMLTDRGLAPALHGLAARATVPVTLHSVIEERLPEGVEAALFYVAAEALTNVAKYAEAREAHVRLALVEDLAVIEIEDDGVGGADLGGGSGLSGLKDRVEALDGKLVVRSDPGTGTLVRAEVPLVHDRLPVTVT